MNKQRNVILAVCVGIFALLTGLLIYRAVRFKQTHYRVGSIPLEIVNQLIPKEAALESLRPPAIRGTDHLRYGDEKSLLSVIEYGDFQCEHCRSMAPVIKAAVAPFKGDVRFVWRDFPLEEINDAAMSAAVFARCAGLQGKFWETYDELMTSDLGSRAYRDIATKLKLDATTLSACERDPAVTAAIKQDIQETRADGILSTPFLFVGTKAIKGFIDAETLTKEIQTALSSL